MIPTADIIGYAATVVGTPLMLPQLYKSWKTKRMKDVSAFMLTLYFFNCALWSVYGIMIGAMPVLVANGVGFLIGCVLLAMKLRYRK
jgi:MtN3 and saliva related transmembrane protein